MPLSIHNHLSTKVVPRQFSVADTFSFRMMEKTPAHPYYGVGDTVSYSVNGVEGGTITMIGDSVYAWVHANMNVVDAPYVATVSARGGGFSPFSRARVGDDFENRIRFFRLPSHAPDTLYYASVDWKWTGGMILVVDSLVSSVREVAAAADNVLVESTVLPNSLSETGVVSFRSPVNGAVELQTIDAAGRVVTESSASVVRGSEARLSIEGEDLRTGVYFYRVVDGRSGGEVITTGSFQVR